MFSGVMRLRSDLGICELDRFGGILCADKRDVRDFCGAVESER